MTGSNRERDALRLAAASHSYSFVARPATERDQNDWNKRWAEIIEKYNSADSKYKRQGGGLNAIVTAGVGTYGAK